MLRPSLLPPGPLSTFLQPVQPALEKLISLDRLERVYERARHERDGEAALQRLLDLLEIGYEVNPGGFDQIPRSGPVVMVANHPFGLLEGALLATLLPKIRPDTRILANSVLAAVPELRERCIFVDPFGRRQTVRGNARALKECLAWVQNGGLLVVFPAGEVAHFDWRAGCVADPEWNPAIATIARRAGAAVVPVFFSGANSLAFQLAGTVHPSLRTMSLPRELLNKRGKRVRISVGRPIPPSTLRSLPDSETAIEYLRCRTYQLAGASAPQGLLRMPKWRAGVAAPVSPPRLAEELERLTVGKVICESQDFAVVAAKAAEMPAVMREIGRLREISFRGAGEGTGRALDLDRFDEHYHHLVLWNRQACEVVGSYRMGHTQSILANQGLRGLYTSTLFKYRRELFDRLGPALELGRSFIRPEYQKQYAPLMLLWKGIVRFAAAHRCPVLFGGVSISQEYHPVSRYLIARFLSAHRMEPLAGMVAARSPYRPEIEVRQRAAVWDSTGIEEVSALVSEIEADGKGVPILVKQYVKAGGKLLGLNVDRAFSNTLDALIMVNLHSAPRSLMERYLGREEAASLFGRNGASEVQPNGVLAAHR